MPRPGVFNLLRAFLEATRNIAVARFFSTGSEWRQYALNISDFDGNKNWERYSGASVSPLKGLSKCASSIPMADARGQLIVSLAGSCAARRTAKDLSYISSLKNSADGDLCRQAGIGALHKQDCRAKGRGATSEPRPKGY